MGQNNSTPKQEFLPKATNKEIDFNVENLFKSSNTTPFMTAKYSPTSMISIDSIPATDLSGGNMTRNIPLRKRYNEFNTGINNNNNNNNNNNTYSSDDVIENLYGGKFNNELSELSHNNNVDMFFNNVESSSLASVSSNASLASLASLASVPNVVNNTNNTNITNVEPDDHYNNYSATSINSIFGGGGATATATASASASTKMSFSETSYNNSLNDVNQEVNFEPDNDIQVLRNNILSATSPNPVQFMKGGADKEDDEEEDDDDEDEDDEDDDEDDEDSSDSSDSDDEEKDKEDKNKDKKKVKKEEGEGEKEEVKPNNLSRSRPTTPTMNRKPTTPKNKKDDSSSSSSLSSSSSFSTSSSSSDENNVNRTDKWSPHLSSSRQFQPAGNDTYKLDSSSDEYKMNKRNYSSSDLHISNSDYLNKMRNRNRFS